MAPLKTSASASDKQRTSALQLQQDRQSVVSYPSRYSNLKTKEVIVLKSENEEKGEVRDLAKFVTQLTQGFFSEIEGILLALDVNSELKDALTMLDSSACSLQAMCSFEYRIERQGEHQGRLMLNKQSQSKSFILNQDIRESAIAVDFKHLAYNIAEKSLTFFVKK